MPKIDILCAVIFIEVTYAFTFVMVIHNTLRYLIPLRITKPLIVWFYIFVTVECISAACYDLWPFYSLEFCESKTLKAIYLMTYVAENLTWAVILLQWLSLTFWI